MRLYALLGFARLAQDAPAVEELEARINDQPDDIEARVMASIDTMPAMARPSQLTDLLAGKPLELDWLSGAVKRLGREAGVATPYHDAAYAALKLYRQGATPGASPAQP